MLFTDIQGSSDGVRTLGADKWESVLERHNDIIRDALVRHGGFEVRMEGDAFFAVFTSPGAAVAAAAAIQRRLHETQWPHQATVRVRRGLPPGGGRATSAAGGADYVGFEITRAARLAAARHG